MDYAGACCIVNRLRRELLLDAADIDWIGTGWRGGIFRRTKSAHYQYVVRGKNMELLHRFLTGAPKGLVVDHINGNGLDNRRVNLRVCTAAQNLLNCKLRADNTSGFKGVLAMQDGRYEARVTVPSTGRLKSLGRFRTALEAAEAYRKAALELHGEFARFA